MAVKHRRAVTKSTNTERIVSRLRNGLIVSCQAPETSPLRRSNIIAALALAAQGQGAVGVRVDGSSHIRAVAKAVSLPVIGIEKSHWDDSPVYITPTFASLRRVCRAGADVVALDATARPRPDDQSLEEIIRRARREFSVPLIADVATLTEGLQAEELGFDLIATTLHGYTGCAQAGDSPAFGLLKSLVRRTSVPVILEGRVRTPDHLKRAFDLGAYAVVVGAAITGVEWLVRRFVEATPGLSSQEASLRTAKLPGSRP